MSKLTMLFMAALLVFVGATGAVAQATEHCPEHNNHPDKIESSDDNYVPPVDALMCVKAGPYATGQVVADGTRALTDYVRDAGIRVGNDNVPGVSYYIVYSTPPPDNGEDPVEEPPVEEPTEEPQEQPVEVDTDDSTDRSNESEAPSATPKPVERDELAYTGATEFLLVVLGLALMATGWYTVRRASS